MILRHATKEPHVRDAAVPGHHLCGSQVFGIIRLLSAPDERELGELAAFVAIAAACLKY